MARPNKIEIVEVLRGAVYLLSLNLLVFLRRQFGERTISDQLVACGFAWSCFRLYAFAQRNFLTTLPASSSAPHFLGALTLATLWQIACIWFRPGSADVHSYSTGSPFLCWRHLRCQEGTLVCFVQPVACLLAGLAFARVDAVVGYWIVTAAICLFTREQLARSESETRVLDTLDSRAESKSLHEAVQERRTPNATASEKTQTATITAKRRGQPVGDFTSRLDPELRDLLDPTNATTPGSDHE